MTYFTDAELETLSTSQLDFVDTCKLSWQLIKRTWLQGILIPYLLQIGLFVGVFVTVVLTFLNQIGQFIEQNKSIENLSEEQLFLVLREFSQPILISLLFLVIVSVVSSFVSFRQIAVLNNKEISSIFVAPNNYFKAFVTSFVMSFGLLIINFALTSFGNSIAVTLLRDLILQICSILVFFAICISVIDDLDFGESIAQSIKLFQSNFVPIITRMIPIFLISILTVQLINFSISLSLVALVFQMLLIAPEYINFVNCRLISAVVDKKFVQKEVSEQEKTVNNGRVMEQESQESDQV